MFHVKSNRFYQQLALAFGVLILALATVAVAQSKKKQDRIGGEPVEITIVNVTKKDAMAKPSPDGMGRVIPVEVQWKTAGEARLINLEAMLKTSNTDGTTSEVKMMLNEKMTSGTLMLKMPNDVFAREYTLTLMGKCVWEGGQGTSKASKSGVFPMPANAGVKK
ncbi:MAG: hypothetical protein SF097_23430 [Acidobacteriota bacterium]|nr:hypothetical protein [Acidobacteriota bacterium]